MDKKSSTIRDVARLAGVAPITVSRVLNESGYVSEKTRAKVLAAVRELQYVPNTLSQSLRHKRTNTIALILSDITNPFWTTISRGVEDACSEHDMNVFLCNTDEKEAKLERYVDLMLQRQTDGFLIVPASDQPTTIRKVQEQSVPLVLIDRKIDNITVDTVRSDSEGGAYEIVHYLLAHGHRHIAVVPGPQNISTSMQRLAGAMRALDEYAIPTAERIIVHGQYNLESDHNIALTERIMREAAPTPTAFFAGNNFIAIAMLQALHKLGLSVPGDISVVSFDDLPYNWHGEPFLTAVAQSPYDLGYRAAELLLSFINGEQKPGGRDIVLPVQLRERQSCRVLT